MSENNGNDGVIVKRAVDALERQNAALGEDVSARLAAARHQALAELSAGSVVPPVLALGNWLPLGAMATTLLAVGLLVAQARVDVLPRFDSEVQAMVAQELDLLEELEFVAWMLEEDEQGAT